MNKYKDIGDRIKHLRGPDTQPEFAKKIGVSLRALQNYENGTRIPKGDVAQRIAAFRGLPVDFLLYGSEGKRKLTLEEARELAKWDLWVEGITPDEEALEKGARSYMKYINEGPSSAELAAAAAKISDYKDEMTIKILELLRGMDKKQKREALRFIEGCRLLADHEKKPKG